MRGYKFKGIEMPNTPPAAAKSSETPCFVIIAFLVFAFPLLVLPHIVDNMFNTPKTLLMQIGVCVLVGVHSFRLLRGKAVPVSKAPTPILMLLVVLLNFFSFFYTRNYYYSVVGATLNLTALLFLHFVSVHATGGKARWLLLLISSSGALVALETWVEFYDRSLLYPWTKAGSMVVGTIGNSNYLGAYLLFPLVAAAGLIFLVRGKARYALFALWAFLFAALLFSRARAAWVGIFFALPLLFCLVARIRHVSPGVYLRARWKKAILGALVFPALIGTLWTLAPDRFRAMMGFSNLADPFTLTVRMQKYYHASWILFKESPLFGTGLWSFRNLVYDAQADIEKTGGNFFDGYPEPRPRRVHNEYLEVLNDGGLVAAAVLAALMWVVMKHGWTVVKTESIPGDDRIIAATAFSAVVGVLVTALFFFPFRINTTLFMTALMLGITEGLYLQNCGLVRKWAVSGSLRFMVIPVILLLLAGWLFYAGFRPFRSELEHLRYKKAIAQKDAGAAEKHILEAINYDPHNSAYLMVAAEFYMGPGRNVASAREFLERAIAGFNGDLTKWTLFHYKGLLAYQTGGLLEARAAFEKALHYNPRFAEAGRKLEEVNRVIAENDRILINLR